MPWPAASLAWANGSSGGFSASISAHRRSPSAQTHRFLLAKQLIHKTRLPMAEVAFAAGFGSIRYCFNEDLPRDRLVARTGRSAERETRPNVSAGPHGKIDLLLRVSPALRLAGHAWRFLPPAGHPWPSRSSRPTVRRARSVQLDGVQGTIARSPADRGQRAARNCALSRLSACPPIWPSTRLRRVFDHWRPIRSPSRPASRMKDPVLAALVEARPGTAPCLAPGTVSSWQCARCWDSRSAVTAAIGLAGHTGGRAR